MSDIYPHYRNISNQYNQEDHTGIEERLRFFLFSAVYLIVFGQYSPSATSTSIIITINYRQFEVIQQVWMKFRLRFSSFGCFFVWYEPDPPRFAKVTWNKFIIYPILPFSSNGQFPNEIIWFQSRNNKFAVFLSLGKISASILQQMENGQIQQQKYFFKRKFST